MLRMRPILVGFLITLLLVPTGLSAQQPDPDTTDGPPFALPFGEPSGPATWLYEQHYGNTTQAFNYGNVWYEFGQGLHFGLDLQTPCDTPVRAIADGVVAYVDADGFGAAPHNLVLQHPGTGYASLYGHLLEIPRLVRGDEVKRGEIVALSGDPDGSCGSRPHLHLEIRSDDYKFAYNPLPFFDVNWHMLVSVGPYNHNFQQDLDAPYRWMTLESQPDIQFSGNILNNYAHPWPLKLEIRAPVNPPIFCHADPLPEDVTVTLAPVALDQWNIGAWWQPTDNEAVYLIDAVPGQRAGVFRQPLDGSPREYVRLAPPLHVSPDGSHTVQAVGGGVMRITRLSDGQSWDIDTGDFYPALATDNARLIWEIVYGEFMPGISTPGVRLVMSDVEGARPLSVMTLTNGYTRWLDDHRLLIVRTEPYTADTDLAILDLDVEPWETQSLGTFRDLKNLQIAPGGERIAFTLAFQENPAANGVYVQRTEPGADARALDFFGAYLWRDDVSLYTLSYDPAGEVHTLGTIDVITGEARALTDPDEMPIRVANGDWSVSPDGSRIVFVDPTDYGLHVVTIGD